MEFGTIRENVEAQAQHSWDELFPPSSMEFSDFDMIRIGSQQFKVAGSAKRLLGQRLGVPAPYIDRCPSDLQATNLNYWLRTLDQETELFCRFEDSTLRAIFTKRYRPMDHHEILRELDVPENTRCIFRIDDNMMQLSIPDPSAKFSVAENDELVPGVALANSEVGLKAFNISAYYLRIVCTNGMLAKDMVNKSFRHTSTKGLDNFYTTMQSVSQKVLQNVDQFKLAAYQYVENPMELIHNFGKHFQLTKQEVNHVQQHYEPPDTMWAVVNAFTAAANDTTLTVIRSYQLQQIGGRILAMVK